ncbi:UNVERIFIED_CONTAM: hypothetical protein K2H54_052733 [Gekko kuhli]
MKGEVPRPELTAGLSGLTNSRCLNALETAMVEMHLAVEQHERQLEVMWNGMEELCRLLIKVRLDGALQEQRREAREHRWARLGRVPPLQPGDRLEGGDEEEGEGEGEEDMAEEGVSKVATEGETEEEEEEVMEGLHQAIPLDTTECVDEGEGSSD